MDLQISGVLLFALFSAGDSLRCYLCTNEYMNGSCADQTVSECISGTSSMCMSFTYVKQMNGTAVRKNLKFCSSNCESGSLNYGISQASSFCCNTDLCNAHDLPDPRTGAPNGRRCYYCDEKSCANIVSCSGAEDRCITVTRSFNQSVLLKGCSSESACRVPPLFAHDERTCCEGNLCNDAQSFAQSFLFLCGFLLSFILQTLQ